MTTDPRQMRPDELPINLQPDLMEAILKLGRHETIVAMVGRSDVPGPVLNVISRHKAPDVRLAVARNASTSADTLISLANDREAKIRSATVPGLTARLSGKANSRPTMGDRKIIGSLKKLAEDELASVRRQVTASMLEKGQPITEVANILAQDLDRAVAEPILTGAPQLDEDLLHKMLEHYPPPWMLKAIAQRKQLGPQLTHEIVEHRNADATGIILDNEGAVIDEKSFGIMVEMAEDHPSLQEPLALHPHLPREEALRLAYFSGERILEMLKAAHKVNPSEARRLARTASRELARVRRIATYEDAVAEAARLDRSGQLDDEFLIKYLDANDPTLLIGSLAFRGRVHPLIVKRILKSESAKAITALVWRAGFRPNLAEEIMERVARLPKNKQIRANHNYRFPLQDTEMVWYLEFFGIDDPLPAA